MDLSGGRFFDSNSFPGFVGAVVQQRRGVKGGISKATTGLEILHVKDAISVVQAAISTDTKSTR